MSEFVKVKVCYFIFLFKPLHISGRKLGMHGRAAIFERKDKSEDASPACLFCLCGADFAAKNIATATFCSHLLYGEISRHGAAKI